MARLPYVDPDEANEEVREALNRLAAPLNIFRMMAHAETCFKPVLRLGGAILGKQLLDAKLRELAILHAVHLEGGTYEWVQHVPIALALGATQAQIDALETG
jgi:alkylhydroperoxidase family enzyme